LGLLLDGLREEPRIVERKGTSFQREFEKIHDNGPPPDTMDKTLLRELQLNARIPLLQLARKVDLSAPSVHRRVVALIHSGIIKSFIPYIQFSYLGYQWYTLHLRTKNLPQQRFLVYLQQHPHCAWLSRRLGKWNYHVSIFARNNTEFNAVVQDLCGTFRENIIAYDSSIIFKQYKFAQRVG